MLLLSLDQAADAAGPGVGSGGRARLAGPVPWAFLPGPLAEAAFLEGSAFDFETWLVPIRYQAQELGWHEKEHLKAAVPNASFRALTWSFPFLSRPELKVSRGLKPGGHCWRHPSSLAQSLQIDLRGAGGGSNRVPQRAQRACRAAPAFHLDGIVVKMQDPRPFPNPNESAQQSSRLRECLLSMKLLRGLSAWDSLQTTPWPVGWFTETDFSDNSY